jgi:hypothetical protein
VVKIIRRTFVFGALAVVAAGVLAAPTPANAFCVANETNVKIHAQSLSAPGFEGDIQPKQHLCCTDKRCMGETAERSQVLVVTGYVLVTKQKGRPGWKAECRAKVKMDEWVEVKGTLNKIACATRKPIPTGWRGK